IFKASSRTVNQLWQPYNQSTDEAQTKDNEAHAENCKAFGQRELYKKDETFGHQQLSAVYVSSDANTSEAFNCNLEHHPSERLTAVGVDRHGSEQTPARGILATPRTTQQCSVRSHFTSRGG